MADVSARDPLITPHELSRRLVDERLRVIDATLTFPGGPQPGPNTAIPGAQVFDIDAVSDHSNPLPHMAPSADTFAQAVSALGVSDGDDVVIYDRIGLFSAPRLWWTFRVFRYERVRVLDGGLPAWIASGGEVRPRTAPKPGSGAAIPARRRSELVADIDDVRSALSGGAQIFDARPAARFAGDTAEPRAGMRSGHMPGAASAPYADVLTPDGFMKPADGLREFFQLRGLDETRPIITTCGSGLTACILALALARIGVWDAAVYDGSWCEWGSREDTPVETGAPA